MKKNIHPPYYQTTVVCACGNTFTIGSTVQGTIKVEVCSHCHPFYTGKQKLIDSTGRVDKFKRRTQMAKELSEKTKQEPAALIDTPVETVSIPEPATPIPEHRPAQDTTPVVREKRPVTKEKKSPMSKKGKKESSTKVGKSIKTISTTARKTPAKKKHPVQKHLSQTGPKPSITKGRATKTTKKVIKKTIKKAPASKATPPKKRKK